MRIYWESIDTSDRARRLTNLIRHSMSGVNLFRGEHVTLIPQIHRKHAATVAA
jgi:hypothetical protein